MALLQAQVDKVYLAPLTGFAPSPPKPDILESAKRLFE
jgi:hypothetical protein